MTGAILTDGEDEPRIERPVRKTKPTAALLQHSEKAALPSQTKAINDFRAAEAAKRAAEVKRAVDAVRASQSTTPNSSQSPSPEAAVTAPVPPAPALDNSKRARVEEVFDDDDDQRENAHTNPKGEFIRY
jgi:hypothetical protein